MTATLWRRLTASPAREAALAAVLAFTIFFAGTADTPVVGRDESRFAEAAREMLDRGDWVVPSFAAEPRYHKPILHYWCTEACYAVLGVSERAARLPSNVAGALSVMVLAWAARRRWREGSGLLAGMLLATTLVFQVEARACTADMVMFLPTLVAMLSFGRMVRGDADRRDALLFWIGIALAVLAKGPIAPAWVLMTAVGLWAFDRQWRRWEVALAVILMALGWWGLGPLVLLVAVVPAAVAGLRSPAAREVLRDMRLGWGLPLALAIVLPWAVAAWIATDGAFFREAIGHHVVDRSFSAFESHGYFPGFYLLTGCIAAFPWFALVAGAPRARWREALTAMEGRFLAAWLVAPLLLLELLQTRLMHYWMPSYPAAVLLLVGWLMGGASGAWRGGFAARSLLLIGGLTTAAVPPGLAAFLGIEELLWPGLLAAVILAAGTLAASVTGRPIRAALLTITATALYAVVIASWYLPLLGGRMLGPVAARRAVELAAADEEIIVFIRRDDDLYFYLPLEVRTCWAADCLEARRRRGNLLVIARDPDYRRLLSTPRSWRPEVVERVSGIDLGHVRNAELVLFRIEGRTTRGPRRGGTGVDTTRGPP